MAWDNYVQKELPGQVMNTIQEHPAGTPSASDIESRIRQLIQENRPAPTPIPENMLTKEAADNLIKEALERQGAEHQRVVQEAIDRAAREARESSIGPTREEIQRMIDQARRRRQGSTSGPNNKPPNLNQAGQIGTTPSGEPFVSQIALYTNISRNHGFTLRTNLKTSRHGSYHVKITSTGIPTNGKTNQTASNMPDRKSTV